MREQLQKRRQGFTLIELLIVIVIIGILAAIAIPKFSQVKDRAYFSAMMSDLKNMVTAQEMYYGQSDYSYANSATLLDAFQESKGVEVTAMGTSGSGDWYAVVGHTALGTEANTTGAGTCAVYVGDIAASGAPTGYPYAAAGAPACIQQ